MGAGGRRAARRLSRPFPGPLRGPSRPWITPTVGVIYGVLVGAFIVGIYQLTVFQTEGPWLELIATALAAILLLTAALFAAKAMRRYREGLGRHGAAWGIATVLVLAIAGLAAYIAVTAAQVGPYISGADVHLTKPVLRGLPRPPGVTLVAERPGPADTESISDEFKAAHLEAVSPFYESELKRLNWTEDPQSEAGLLRFRKGQFVVTILAIGQGKPQGPGDYAVTVDRSTSPPPSNS